MKPETRAEELTLTEAAVGAEPSESIADLMRKVMRRSEKIPIARACGSTPERFEKALRFLTSGYQQDPRKVLKARCSACAMTRWWW